MLTLDVRQYYSQRDSKWASIMLGYNTAQPYTIGNFGCLITCLAMYLTAIGKKTDPAEINHVLKLNDGFAAGGGLFVWSSFKKIFGVGEYYISPRYENEATDFALKKMRELLDEGRPLIAEVDFNPNTFSEEMHFILIIGYDGDTFYAVDPWTGTKIDMSVYGGIRRALYQFRAYETPLVPTPINENELQVSLNAYFNLQVTASMVIEKIEKIKEENSKKDDVIADKEKTITEQGKQLVIKGEELQAKTKENLELTKKLRETETALTDQTEATKKAKEEAETKEALRKKWYEEATRQKENFESEKRGHENTKRSYEQKLKSVKTLEQESLTNLVKELAKRAQQWLKSLYGR